MLDRIGMRCAFAAALILGMASGAFAADDGVWSVSKSTGEVWIATDGAQQVSLNPEETLKPGNTIRTGRNGRVLLVRGEETILIAPNSVVGLPAEKKEGLSTTIIQQAGSILLEVEKRNVKHFEVETPYLAAVVKGTKFSVTVGAGSTNVGVLGGQVEVSDFRTGQIAQVMPGQAATVSEHGKPGLSLSGAGTFNPIEHGKPRAPTVERIPVPKSGLTAPRNAGNGHAIHALGPVDKGSKAAGADTLEGGGSPKPGVVRISSSLGEVKLNVHKATRGLAHGVDAPGQVRRANASTGSQATVWSDGKTNPTGSNSSVQTALTTSGGATAGNGASHAGAAIAAATAGASSDSPGADNANGGGNNGNNGHGNNGATGNGRGNNGNGHGNGGGNGSNGHGVAHGRR
jgi:hypothetical protein